jgi:hypothetical protein
MQLPNELSKATGKHCAAITYGDLSDFIWKGSAKYIKQQGTITFIEYKGECYGITNNHVVEDACLARVQNNKYYVFVIALKEHTRVKGFPIFRSNPQNPDFPYDIAIFHLNRKEIIDGGKQPINLQVEPLKVNEGDKLLAVGFPGKERQTISSEIMAHQMYHVVATCHSISDRQIILHDHLPDKRQDARFPGISGGPIFSVTEDYNYQLQGIVHEGRGFCEMIDRKLVEYDDIWVWGHPFSIKHLEQALALAKR